VFYPAVVIRYQVDILITVRGLRRSRGQTREMKIIIRENSKNDPVNVLYSEFDPKHLDISINDPLQCVFFA
jgi:hypothetical protein